MLDLVERDVLTPLGVSFLRLDGSVDAGQRFGIVQVGWMPHSALLALRGLEEWLVRALRPLNRPSINACTAHLGS